MKNTSSYAVLTRFGIIAAVLATLVLIAPAASATDMIEYAEDRDDAIAVLRADDEDLDTQNEGDVKWSLQESADHALFAIDENDAGNGVLTWKDGKTPSFEDPKDTGGDGEDYDNIYQVTVVANNGTIKLLIEIADVEEEGKLELNQPQPQVGITVSEKDNAVSDDDGDVAATTWQWSKSMDMADWTEISGAKSSSYEPKAADANYYLRLTATYNDRRGEGKTAMVVSENPVDAKRTANSAPKFAKEGDADGTRANPFMRTVKEDFKGAFDSPVVATDSDSGDIVLHTLGGPDQEGNFSVDARSGQLSTSKELDYETVTTTATDSPTPPAKTLLVQVTATDSSLATAMAWVYVEVEDVNEAPEFAKFVESTSTDPAAQPLNSPKLTVDENDVTTLDADATTGSATAPTYSATDEDSLDDDGTPVPDTVELKPEGPDGSKFTLTSDGAVPPVYTLTFNDHVPNYEKQSKYEVHIVARDANAEAATRVPAKAVLKVEVTVNNVEEDGVVSLSQLQMQAGVPVTATLEDDDDGVRGLKWQWSRRTATDATTCPASGAPDPDGVIASAWVPVGATDDTYTPGSSDVPSDSSGDGTIDTWVCLQATATYKDNVEKDVEESAHSGRTTAQITAGEGTATKPAEARPASNAAPDFGKEDANDDGTEEDGSADNPFLRNVDENVTDDFGETVGASDGDGDDLLYTVDGADAFGIDKLTGQLKTTSKLDFETKSEYMITVTATDPSLAATTVHVKVTVNDKDDKASVQLSLPPAFATDMAAFDIAENSAVGTAVGQVTADDPNEDDLTYGLDEMGALYFDIDAMGQITTAEMLDHEETASYTVTVTADDGTGFTDTIEVTITVTDANDAPMFGEAPELSVAENSEAGTEVGMVMAMDQDEDELTYSLDEMGDMYFDIDAMGQITVGEGAMLDYETATSHEVTVMVNDGSEADNATASMTVTIMVTDVPESPCVTGGAVEADGALATDCETLLGIMDELIGDGTATLNWSAETPIGDWNGVATRGTGRVGGIYLPGGHDNLGGGVLAGTIPASFNTLVALERLTLRNNNLTGEIPDLSALDNLEYLILNSNSLSGSLPATLGDMAEIDYLYLHNNSFSGAIPAELGNATRLRRLYLRNNDLTGEIPSELGGLSRLRNLLLDGNDLSGAIPSELGSLSNLKALYLQGNMLTGSIPAELGSIMSAADDTLRLLYLHNNMLTGDVPAELGNLASLKRILLSGNMLTGCIPAAIIDAADDAAAAGLAACADDGNGNGES